jgi:flagellar protein FliO/FliZ
METLFLALRVLVALGAVLGLIWFVQRKLTRGSKKSAIASRFGGNAKRPIQVLGSHRLTAKASITVVEIDGVKLVLGVTEQGISVLEPAPAAPVVLAATPVAATIAEPAAIGSESDPTQVAAPAEDALASAGVEPAPVDFAAVFREALDEASATPAISTVVEPSGIRDEQHVAKPRRRRTTVPALREQLLPHMTRTLAAAIGIRVADAPSVPAEPATTSVLPVQNHPTSATSALAAFLSNSTPEKKVKDYSTATPLAANLPVLQRAS